MLSVVNEGVAIINDLRAQVVFLQTSDLIGRRIISEMLGEVGKSFKITLAADDEIVQAVMPGSLSQVTLVVRKLEHGLDVEVSDET